MSPEEAQEEFNEVQADLKKKEDEVCDTLDSYCDFICNYLNLHFFYFFYY